MNFIYLLSFSIILININTIIARKECIERQVPNADTVCVCNATYCDDIPTLNEPKPGFVTVYESSKSGHRFKESVLEFNIKESIVSNTSESVLITIDNNITYQSIFGFGGAFTDTTGQMLTSVNQSLADLILDSYFADNGIEYSMARIPIAGTDYSVRPYSYDDVEGDLELKHFALQEEDIKWKIPFIQKALKISPHKIKLFSSPWNPPAWMKSNNKFNESGYLKGEVGGQYYQTWAEYFVKFLDEYKKHGLVLWGLTVQNEPWQGVIDKNHPFNSLNMSSQMQRDFVKQNLGPTLEKAGYGKDRLNLMIFDDNAIELKTYIDPILSDTGAAKYVSGIAYHWYHNHPMSGFPDGFLTEIHNNFSNYFLLNTEACHLEGPVLGRWDYAERYAFDIIRALNNWVKGWVEWNMALDMNGGPRWCDKDKPGFGGAINIDPSKGEAYKQPSFYTIGHFSKYVSPDSQRIEHSIDRPVNGLSVLTIRRPDNQTVLVALNAADEDMVLNIRQSDNHLSHKIPAHSIQSYIW